MRSWSEDLKDLRPHECELRIQKANGDWAWFHVHASPLLDEAGHVVCWTGVHHGITDEKIAEEEIVRSRLRVERLGHLANADLVATSLASRMRDPINEIARLASITSSCLTDNVLKSQEIELLLKKITEECSLAAQAVVDVRRAFNVQTTAKSVVPVKSVVSEMLRHVTLSTAEVESNVRVDINPGLEFTVDSFKMQQVFRIILGRILSTRLNERGTLPSVLITASKADAENVAIRIEYAGSPLQLEAADFSPVGNQAVPYDVELAVARALIQGHGGHLEAIKLDGGNAALRLVVPDPLDQPAA